MLGPRKQINQQQGILSNTQAKLESALARIDVKIDFRGKPEALIKQSVFNGLSILDIYLEGLVFASQKAQGEFYFTKNDKDSFRTASGLFTKMAFENFLFSGWHMNVSPESALEWFTQASTKMDAIIEQLKKLRVSFQQKNAAVAVKFFSDLIVHFRTVKLSILLNIASFKVKVLPKNQDPTTNEKLIAILNMHKELQKESAYLRQKIKETDKANLPFDSLDSFFSQLHFSILSEISQVFYIDPTTNSLIETINRKKLLSILENNTDENSTHTILKVATNMVSRLMSLHDLPFAWKYLELYFKTLEKFNRLRQRHYSVTDNVRLGTENIPNIINTLFASLRLKFELDTEFCELVAYYDVILKLNNLSDEYKPKGLTAETFSRMTEFFQREREQHLKKLSHLFKDHITPANEAAVLHESPTIMLTLPYGSDIIPHDFRRRFSRELRNNSCKVEYTFSNKSLQTGDLSLRKLEEIEVFCRTYAKVFMACKEEAISHKLEAMHLEATPQPEVVSSRQYLNQPPVKKEKKKTKGTPAKPVVVIEEQKETESEFLDPEEIVKLFGDKFKDCKIKLLPLDNMVNDFYVCLDVDQQACTKEELKKFRTLFDNPKHALKCDDQGFKWTGVLGDVTLCAKAKGKAGRLRAYPDCVVENKATGSVLYFYNKIVCKGSRQEKQHVVEKNIINANAAKKTASTKKKRK